MKEEKRYRAEESEFMPQEKLREYQLKRLLTQLKYAYENSAYYRRSFDQARIKLEDIKTFEDYYQKIPFLTKSQILENQNSRPPFGDFLAVKPEELIIIYLYPGPLFVPFASEDYDGLVEASARSYYIAGVRREDNVDIAAPYHWLMGGTLTQDVFRKIGCTVIPGGMGTPQIHVEVMKKTKTTVLFSFPTFVAQLGVTAREMGIDPSKDLSIRLIFILGEAITETTKRELAKTFGAEVYEAYGTSELGGVAFECPVGGGMHLSADTIVEVIDPDTGQHVPIGESGELVASDLGRRAMPIIRNRTGDIIEGLNPDPCPCGRTTPRLKRIIGRVGDIARIKGMFVVPRQVEGVLKTHPQLGRYQIVVDRPELSDELIIKVECKEPVAGGLRETLAKELEDAIRMTPEVDLVKEGTIREDASLVDDRRKL